jgi:hypothetical protein
MTKPDMLSGSTKSRALWLDVIEGRRHPLRHGYYCTRQPDDEERAKEITSAGARKAETAFFSSTEPWSTSSESSRFGTDNLVATLSTLLVNIISEKWVAFIFIFPRILSNKLIELRRLPIIIETATNQLDECRAALAGLPMPSMEDPATQLLTLITEFCSGFKRSVRGASEPSVLIQRNNAAFGDFKIAIRRTAPMFVAQLRTDPNAAECVVLHAEDEEELSVSKETPGDERIYLDDIRETVDKCVHPINPLFGLTFVFRARTRELPGDIPASAKTTLVAGFQGTWLPSTETCLRRVNEVLHTALMCEIHEVFGRYNNLKNRLR